jgi:hypothetical protein
MYLECKMNWVSKYNFELSIIFFCGLVLAFESHWNPNQEVEFFLLEQGEKAKYQAMKYCKTLLRFVLTLYIVSIVVSLVYRRK